MGYDTFPRVSYASFPVSPQYARHPGSSVNAIASPSYATFPYDDGPLAIFGADLLLWLNGDCGVDTGTGTWTDCVNGYVFTPNGTPMFNPSLLNGHGGWSWVRASAQRHTNNTIDLPAPPFTTFLVARQDGWNNGASLIGHPGGSTSARILQGGASPQLQMNNGSSVNTNGGLALSTWGLITAEYTNSVADTLRCGSTDVTGANAGATNPAAGMQIAATGSAAHASLSATDVIIATNASAARKTALAAWVTSRYGAILV